MIVVSFYIYIVYFFLVIDAPAPDPLFDLSLNVGQHCYGLNLGMAHLMVQQDSDINRRQEDRFQISGLACEGRPPAGFMAQKAAGLKILNDLIAGWYPVTSRPNINDCYVPRVYVSTGVNTLPPIIFVFADYKIAAQIRDRLLTYIRSSPLPSVGRWWIEPVLTKATLVRIEILKAIRQSLAGTVVRCSVQSKRRAPLLFVSSVGGDKVYGFVEACQVFGHMLTAERLTFAYRLAGRMFQSRLAATFLVLRDGAQPVANFFVPAPRAVATTSVAVTTATVVTPVVVPNVPPPVIPNYLQRALSAPVPSGSGSGSGRKRPAESLESTSKR